MAEVSQSQTRQLKLTKALLGEYECEMTKAFDKHLIKPHRNWSTYMCPFDRGRMVLRYPGATRGCIWYDENNVITDIKFYKEGYDNEDTLGGEEYHASVQEEANKYIGCRLIF